MNTRRIIIIGNIICVLAILAKLVSVLVGPPAERIFLNFFLMVAFGLPYGLGIAALFNPSRFQSVARVVNVCAVILLLGVAGVGVASSSSSPRVLAIAVIATFTATAIANIWWLRRKDGGNAG